MDSVKQRLLLEDKKKLSFDGVRDIEGFSEDFLEVNTCYGTLCVEGSELKIEELVQEGGRISVIGNITGIFYKEKKENKNPFGKLFK